MKMKKEALKKKMEMIGMNIEMRIERKCWKTDTITIYWMVIVRKMMEKWSPASRDHY